MKNKTGKDSVTVPTSAPVPASAPTSAPVPALAPASASTSAPTPTSASTSAPASKNILGEEKRNKLRKMREKGFDPYPHSFHRSHSFLQVRDAYDHQLTVGETLEVSSPLSVAGRMVTYRSMGKAAFFHLQDEKDRLQVYLRKEDLSERDRELLSLVDIGDILGIESFYVKAPSLYQKNFMV